MMTSLEVLFTPADFGTLRGRDLSQAGCVVFDVLRATTSMVTALANGAAMIIPVEEIGEALEIRKQEPDVLLAGERDGVRIEAKLTGSISFDLGNSPREFMTEKVSGRTIVMTTTNGTRALRACAGARSVLAGSFLNLRATADFINRGHPPHLLLVCSGTFDQAAYEDVLAAGAFCDLIWTLYDRGAVADSVHMARELYHRREADLAGALSRCRNGRRLLANPNLRADVPFCVRRNLFPIVVTMDREGRLSREAAPERK
jgi:2-phosphosulfolactate phosphatase